MPNLKPLNIEKTTRKKNFHQDHKQIFTKLTNNKSKKTNTPSKEIANKPELHILLPPHPYRLPKTPPHHPPNSSS
jgi:hypothetical protein